MRMGKGHRPTCLLSHGWLPLLSGVNGASPWAADASESAGHLLEVALGPYSSRMISEWSVLEDFDAETAFRVPDVADVWTDGSLVLDEVTGVSSSGSGFFAHQSELCWGARSWGRVDPVGEEGFSCIVSVQFRGLYNLFRELSCGVLFWLCSILMLCIWELTI